MNRVYRLVWNRSLAAVQVASELADAQGSSSGTSATRTPRRHPLALAIAALALACASAPAWSQTCTPADPSGCGAAGGVGGRPGRSPTGGAGNGTGGDAIVWNPNTSESAGTTATNGTGGNGANGIFNVGSVNITSSGGAGGVVGATGSQGVVSSVTGSTGGAGQAESGSSVVGGGGGGGGAGVYINDGNSSPIVGSTTTLAGGAGGRGGDATATASNGNATNGDPGGGGGGGAGVIIASGAGGVSLINNGRLLGGAGGAGGNGGYAGSGGGGGDGLLVLGAGAAVTNNSTGSIIGGLGGNPGIYQDGGNLPGGYGGGGAGVNLVGAGSSLENAGTIIGGNASTVSPIPSAQDGTPGVGVRGWGGVTVVTDGTIAGGSNGTVQADSVLFSGGGNQLVILSGAIFTGAIQSISGSTNGGDILTLAGDVNGSINAGLIVGFASNTKTGNSNWTLTGTGNAGIDWTIQQGELTGNSSAFGGNLAFVSNGIGTPSADFNQTAAGSFAGSISGTGQLIKDGTGSLTLAGDLSTFSGLFTINQGTVALSNNGNLQGAEMSDGGTFDISGTSGSTATIAGISGSGVVTLGSHTLVIDNATNDNFSGSIVPGGTGTGLGGVTLNGGAQTFSGSNTYLGGTTINGGTLAVSSDANLGDSSGVVVLSGGTLETTGTFATVRSFTLANSTGGTLQTNADLTISGNIIGNGMLTKTGTGTLTLNGVNNYTGGTTITAGTLQGDTISLQGNILDNAALVFNQITNGTYSGVISGAGTLTKTGTGTLTLSGVNNYTGGTTITAGTLQGDTASLQGNILNNAALVFNQTTNGTYSGVISGGGTLTANGTGTLILDGVNTATGLTTVASGATLIVGDSSHATATVGGDVSVNGGTLGGYGTVSGSVTLSNSAALTPGEAGAIGSLTIGGDLTVGSGSRLNFDFGSPGPNFSTPGQSDHVVVNGNLSIDTSTLNVNNLGSMGPGLYNLFDWGNSLSITGGGFAPPSGMSLQILTVDKQINLVDTLSLTLDEWDANGLASPGQMGGGSGTWSISSNTWSDITGQFVGPMSPQPGFAIFGGTPGTVTVDDTSGTVGVTGMQFVSDGYHLTGGAIDLVGQNGVAPVMRVSSGDTAIIDNVLQGTDGLNKTDGGTLVLTGNNLYTGKTTLSGGYLSVSSDANLGASTNPLDFEGGTLEITGTSFNQTARNIIWGSAGGGFNIDDASNTFTVSQALSGHGGLLKSGAGTLVLTGSNTYLGDTMIDAGILQLGNGGTTGSMVSNIILNGGTLVFDHSGNDVYSGNISGNGSVIDRDANLTLSGATFGGALGFLGTIYIVGAPGSSLQLGNLDRFGFVPENVYIGAGNLFATGGLNPPITMSGVISGPGALSVFNANGEASPVYLTGTDTYTGGTTVLGNWLVLGKFGTTGSIVGNVVLGSESGFQGILDFFHSGSETFAGVISGSGRLYDDDAGILTLTGNNTFTGTTVVGGRLQLGDGGTSGGLVSAIYLDQNSMLSIDESGTVTLPGAISGTGSLSQIGTGTTILTGNNTYIGGTTISAGTLEVGDSNSAAASIAGPVRVQDGGTLRGHGTINGNVTSDGKVWPGGSMGTLTINGNYTQNADGTLQLDVTPTQSSMLKVNGNASLAGKLDLIFAPGTYGDSKFDLVQGGSITGAFGTINGTVPGAVPSRISYSSAEVALLLGQRLVMPLDGNLYGNLMRSTNVAGQQDLGSVLDVALTPSGTQCNADHASSMQNVTASCGTGAWAQYTGSNISLNGTSGSNSTTFGLLGGADYALGDVLHAGVEAGVGQVNGNDTIGGNGRVDSVHGGLYAYANAGPVVLSATIDDMHSEYHFNRATGIGTATSTPDGTMQSAAVQAAWPFQLSQWQLTPKVGAIYQRQTLDGFSETLYSTNPNASSFPVDGARSRYTTLQPYADMAIEHSFVAQGVTYVPQVSLGYRYDTHNNATPIVQVTAQDGTVFDLPGATQGRGMGTASARITAEAGASWSLYADYQGFFGSRLHDNALSVGFTKHF
ncbi:hypothetical protein GCM10007862_29890 [Dyella lipolytica]|uniref:Autotransporter-associated beta strand repeat-containing protein n=1 Tax=Dyella lipolytica TaxID=1867835 RepID=A0ABW8IVN4_9GAMM|nr:autotransporter-associated beta strand repeat-containing protein [Dyella lipolytica]GLQ47938.1 hypothetical protein GCM10007862_29890 [Dyella lipolytica]